MIFTLEDETEAQRLWLFLRDKWKKAAQDGKPLVIDVQQGDKPQTRRQQRRYRAILREIAGNAWVDGKQYPMETWHSHFASTLIGEEHDEFGLPIAQTTTQLNVAEMNAFMEEVIVYATTVLGLEIQTY